VGRRPWEDRPGVDDVVEEEEEELLLPMSVNTPSGPKHPGPEKEEGWIYEKDLELTLTPERRQSLREVVREIKKFGIAREREFLYLIYLLTLELEHRPTVTTIVSAIKERRQKPLLDDALLTTEDPGGGGEPTQGPRGKKNKKSLIR
jgi:hypothetical protein